MELLQPKNIKLSNLLSVCIFSAEKAGKEIIKIHKNGFKTFDKSFNQNFGRRVKSFDPCTEADIKSQEIIESALKTEFPGIFIIGEEKTSSAKKVAEKSNFGNISFKNSENFDVTLLLKDIIVWIDPLDGTREFVKNNIEAVTVLVGISYKNKPIAGVIVQPFYRFYGNATNNVTENEILTIWGANTKKGQFVNCNKDILPDFESCKNEDGRRIIVSKNIFGKYLSYVNRCRPKKVVGINGCGRKAIDLICGKVDAFVFANFGTKKWDVCALHAIIEAAGGKLTKPNGQPLIYDKNFIENPIGFVATLTKNHFYYIK